MSTYDTSDGTEGSALRAIDWPTKCGLAGSRIARSKPNFPATASMRCESADPDSRRLVSRIRQTIDTLTAALLGGTAWRHCLAALLGGVKSSTRSLRLCTSVSMSDGASITIRSSTHPPPVIAPATVMLRNECLQCRRVAFILLILLGEGGQTSQAQDNRIDHLEVVTVKLDLGLSVCRSVATSSFD